MNLLDKHYCVFVSALPFFLRSRRKRGSLPSLVMIGSFVRSLNLCLSFIMSVMPVM